MFRNLDNGRPLLEHHFGDVAVHHLRAELVVPDLEPVVRYADSCRSLYELQLPDDVTWEEAMSRFTALVGQEINDTGAWRTPTHSGVFVCR